MISEIWAKIKAMGAWVIIIGALAAAGYVGYTFMEHKHAQEQAKARAEAEKRLADQAAELGYTKADLVSAKDLARSLKGQLAESVAKLKKAGGIPTTHATITASITDTAKGAVTQKPEEACPSTWADEYHRFDVDLKSGLLKRTQLFGLDLVIVRSPGSENRFAKAELYEYDPKTKEAIPTKGVTLGLKVDVTDDGKPVPSRWRLRGLAAIDHQGAPGGGIGVTPTRHLSLAAIGLYNPRKRTFQGVLHGGYRLFNTTLAVGPYVGYSSKARWVAGALATIELTR